MPRPAAAIAIQVRGGKCWCRKLRANSAVTSGASAIVISTLATLVSVNATMKAVNITAQQMPEIQTLRGQSGSCRHMVRLRIAPSARVSVRALKKLRQNVTSKLRAASRWRATTPAMLHSRVTTIIRTTARAWLIWGAVLVRKGW